MTIYFFLIRIITHNKYEIVLHDGNIQKEKPLQKIEKGILCIFVVKKKKQLWPSEFWRILDERNPTTPFQPLTSPHPLVLYTAFPFYRLSSSSVSLLAFSSFLADVSHMFHIIWTTYSVKC